MSNEQKTTPKQPQANTQRITSRHDLPQTREHCTYTVIKPDGLQSKTVLGKRKRQILEALRKAPIYAASPVRVSDLVWKLNHLHGIHIKMELYEGGSGAERTRYGVYFLIDTVTRDVAAEQPETAEVSE